MASEYAPAPVVSTRDRVALYAVNFFMADMEAGMGPFLGVLLQSRGWSTGAIGGAITLQVLDGVGAGILSVAVPGLVARILNGTGHINIGQGAVMAAQGLGGALSPVLGGVAAQTFGFPAAFTMLGGLSLGSLIIWLVSASTLRGAGGE